MLPRLRETRLRAERAGWTILVTCYLGHRILRELADH